MSASNKADLEWDSHKATIESLYVERNLEFEESEDLMDFMINSHRFAKRYRSLSLEYIQGHKY